MPTYAFTYLLLGGALAALGVLIGIPLALHEREDRRTQEGKQAGERNGKERDPAVV